MGWEWKYVHAGYGPDDCVWGKDWNIKMALLWTGWDGSYS